MLPTGKKKKNDKNVTFFAEGKDPTSVCGARPAQIAS